MKISKLEVLATTLLLFGCFYFPAIAQIKKTSFGLGTPRTSGIGGAVRTGAIDSCPNTAILSPLSGSRVLSDQPELFWYVEGKIPTMAVSVIVRDQDTNSSKRVFTANGTATQSGLYRFALPAKLLIPGKTQRWDLRIQTESCTDLGITNAAIRLEPNPSLAQAIAKATNSLERAKLYQASGYWFDALAAYETWLATNPQDQTARQERNAMIKAGLAEYNQLPGSGAEFVQQIPAKIAQLSASGIKLVQP
ncbi:MAG: DUF928 domain-containing protein [Pseudanabaenaceae cyanobacterium bins.68]|nr:DUF928 domain-containing protein [Pseudanabaenaceae cyanobacterium bins.68]